MAKKTTTKKAAIKPVEEKAELSTFNPEEDAGNDFSNDDLAIPRIGLLQDNSPQCKKKHDLYIDGAEAGMICDTALETMWDGDEGLIVVPVSYKFTYIEWRLRTEGGGFVAEHNASDGAKLYAAAKEAEVEGKTVKIAPNSDGKHQLVPSASYFIYVIGEDGIPQPYAMSMASSQIKKSKRWNTLINQLRVLRSGNSGGTYNPAMFYRSYHVTTVPESSNNNSWWGWKITADKNVLELPQGEEIYTMAREFHKSISSGSVRAATHNEEAGATSKEDSDDDAF